MKKILLSLSIIAGIIACNPKNNKNLENQPIISKGLVTPVYMQQDTTEIFLSDYVLFPNKIDSIEKSNVFEKIWDKQKEKLQIIPHKSFQNIENLRIYQGKKYLDIPLFKSTLKQVVFTYPKQKEVDNVQFKSQITGWQAVPMQSNDSVWYFKAELDPGNYQYLFVVNGKEILDQQNSEKVSNGLGGFNSLLKIDDNLNKKPFLIPAKTNEDSFEIAIENKVAKILVYVDNQLFKLYENIDKSKLKIPYKVSKKGRSHIRIFAYNDFGRSNDLLLPLQDGKIITDASQLNRRDFQTQIMYFLMVDRFYDGEKSNNKPVQNDSVLPKVNFKGGDLQGVLKQLEKGYFKGLGINTIWLSPILKNPEGAYGKWKNPPTKFSGYHGYWPVSNIKIDRRFGDKKSLKKLINAVHQENTNIILDYVANHIHKNHPLYKIHPDWFTDMYLPDGTLNLEKWDSHRLTTWFDTFLPTIDFSRHEIVEAMTDSAMVWLEQYNIDGFRHDATKHIQLDYWRTLTSKIKHRIHRPVYQIGETYGSPQLIRSYVNSGMLDAQFNFNLYDAGVAVFAKDSEPVKRLADAIQESLIYYGYHNLMGNISGNQDRVRFISYASGDVKFDENGKQAGWDRSITISDTTAYQKMENLMAFNMFVPGVPCIYYGDEIGMPGANDPDNRRMMQFEGLNKQQKRLKNHVKNLIDLRKKTMALLYGTTTVKTEGDVLIIARRYFDEKMIFIYNKSNRIYKYKNHKISPGSYRIIRNINVNF